MPVQSCMELNPNKKNDLSQGEVNFKILWKVIKLNKQQNSSFRLIKTYLVLRTWERIPYFVYKLKPVQNQTLKDARPYFCRYSEQKIQDWQNLQKLINPVTTFIIFLMNSFGIF